MTDEIEITLRVPRWALVHQPAAPEIVTQHNSLQTIGLKPRQFLELIRSAPLPVIKTGQTRGVQRDALLNYLAGLCGTETGERVEEISLAQRLGLEVSRG